MKGWQRAAAFPEGLHKHPPNQSPGENHPRGYGTLKPDAIYMTNGVYTIALRSTPRRKDGWSYNVVTCFERPFWFGYFHHWTGARVRHSGTHPPSTVEQQWGLERAWSEGAPTV
jgi:hypothetical protein